MLRQDVYMSRDVLPTCALAIIASERCRLPLCGAARARASDEALNMRAIQMRMPLEFVAAIIDIQRLRDYGDVLRHEAARHRVSESCRAMRVLRYEAT